MTYIMNLRLLLKRMTLPFLTIVPILLFLSVGYSQTNYLYDQMGRLKADWPNGIVLIEWTNTNKIARIVRADTCHTPDLEFRYDSFGNRTMKIVKLRNGASLEPEHMWQYYFYQYNSRHDVEAVYKRVTRKLSDTQFSETIEQSEQNLYAGNRIGVARGGGDRITHSFNAAITPDGRFSQVSHKGTIIPASVTASTENSKGLKSYELVSHQKNVLATLSDRKINREESEIQSASNYYPFGMPMPQQQFEAGENKYHYGFNGQEKTKEISPGHYTARYWEYDARLARRWNEDPVIKPSQSGYVVLSNNPVAHVDPHGDDDYFSAKGELVKQTEKGSNIYVNNGKGRDIPFHGLSLETSEERFAAKKILAYYGEKVGLKTTTESETPLIAKLILPYWIDPVQDMQGEEESIYLEGGGEFGVRYGAVGSSALMSTHIINNSISLLYEIDPLLTNYHNLMSTLWHESQHRTRSESNVPLAHAQILIDQMNRPDFYKATLKYRTIKYEYALKYLKQATAIYNQTGLDTAPILKAEEQLRNTAHKDPLMERYYLARAVGMKDGLFGNGYEIFRHLESMDRDEQRKRELESTSK